MYGDSSGKALTALILGICGLFVCPFLLPILAIVFATQARAEMAESRTMAGASQAYAGLVLGWVGLVVDVLGLLVILLFVAG